MHWHDQGVAQSYIYHAMNDKNLSSIKKIELFNRAIALNESSVEARLGLAAAYENSGFEAMAKNEYEIAILLTSPSDIGVKKMIAHKIDKIQRK
ncbi:hypothetical protein HA050_19160 [Iodobacter sp. HSC-16F04]|uniref:Tetratricopeptide repeat protein n=1 Tax=Iodobacter violaceini TaxID=3044271 RepID=A0ABX0L144_9NEIS|nr:hypothetical protein [Iodobacter violacea]NHQ88227.1 hypothetical protein [Iodobacter violacea]